MTPPTTVKSEWQFLKAKGQAKKENQEKNWWNEKIAKGLVISKIYFQDLFAKMSVFFLPWRKSFINPDVSLFLMIQIIIRVGNAL